jgi:hypothetical protein
MRYILFLLLITSIASAQDTMVFIKPIVVGTDSIKFRRDTYITPDSMYTLTRDTLAITVTPLPAPPDTSTRFFVGNALSRDPKSAAAQDWFDSGIYLPVGNYYFEGQFRYEVAGGSASHNIRSTYDSRSSLVINRIDGIAIGSKGNVGASVATNQGGSFNSSAALQVSAATTVFQGRYKLSGFMNVSTAGVFMPQFSFNTSTGAATTSCTIWTVFKITKIP